MTLARLTATLGLACMKKKKASWQQGKEGMDILSSPFSTLIQNHANGSDATTVDDASNWLSLPGSQSARPPWSMLVPASMAMVRVQCCGFEIFYVFGLGYFFGLFSFSTLSSSDCFLPSFLSLSPSFAPRHHFSHLTLVPRTFLAVPERHKEFMSHCSRMSRICIQKGPTLPAASRASLGRSISRSPFFLGLRLPRCEIYAVLDLAIDFLMPAPVHRAPAFILLIDF